jgi:hypothetical protein
MRLPLRLLHVCAPSFVIGALAFAVTTALRRYLFRGAKPLWAAILTAMALAPARGADRAAIIAALRTASPAIRTLQVLIINLFIATLAWALLRRAGKSEAGAPAHAEPHMGAASSTLRAKLPIT